MIDRLLPSRPDLYRGLKAGLWVFVMFLFVRLAMSFNFIFNTRYVAVSADGIPLDSYPTGASNAILSLFAVLGLSRAMTVLLGVIVLVRYRGLVPLMFVLFLLEQLSRSFVVSALPIAGARPNAGGVNTVLSVLLVVGLLLSLIPRRSRGASQV